MALTDLIGEYLRQPDAVENFIDFSVHPPVETTPAELLALVLDAVHEPEK